MNIFCHTVSEELHSQDLTMLHYVWNSQTPIIPTTFVKSKWWHSRLICIPTKNEQIPSWRLQGSCVHKVSQTDRQRETITRFLSHRAVGDNNITDHCLLISADANQCTRYFYRLSRVFFSKTCHYWLYMVCMYTLLIQKTSEIPLGTTCI